MLSLHDRSICSQVLCKVRDRVASDLHSRSGPRIARSKLWKYPRRVINKVAVKSGFFNLIFCEISCQLMDNGSDHL